MHLVAGTSKNSWQPVKTANSTTLHYWFNWRVLLCAIWILMAVGVSAFLIWRYEGSGASKHGAEENREEKAGSSHEYESWRPCLKEIHPAWLLAFRVTAFFVLLALLIANSIVGGGAIFYYYTQWTFTLVTIYFGLGSFLSLYGCFLFRTIVGGDRIEHIGSDAERSTPMAPPRERNAYMEIENSHQKQRFICRSAAFWSRVFQVIYQICAGAVMLTDVVFWLIIFPFLNAKDYALSLLLVCMHSVNAVFLLAETIFNCLHFPWFRIAYFMLWTCTYVTFLWIIHAAVSLWWPYPFLDLSKPYAPLWYVAVAVLQIPCYAIFVLVIKTKHYFLSRQFPHSYQCSM